MKNSQKGSVTPLLIGVIVVLLVGVGIYIYKNKKVETPSITNTNTPLINQAQKTNPLTKPSILHIDKANGYQLKLPNDWAGYRVVNGAFQLPTDSKTWYEMGADGSEIYGFGTVFTILKYSSDDWNKMKEDCGVRGGQNWGPGCFIDEDALGQTNTHIFVAVWPNSGPSVGGDIRWGSLSDEVTGDYLKNNFSIES